MAKSHKKLSPQEREKIFGLVKEGASIREIGRQLGRSHSSINLTSLESLYKETPIEIIEDGEERNIPYTKCILDALDKGKRHFLLLVLPITLEKRGF